MMREVFVVSDNIFSPLGHHSADNFEQLRKGISGITQHHKKQINDQPFYASLFKEEDFDKASNFTRFEQALIRSIEDAIKGSGVDPKDERTIFILSSTKGNISLLESEKLDNELKERMSLPHSANLIAAHFGFVHEPIIISHACISGLLAIITAMRMLQSGLYEHAIVAGADMITKFILSGFQSFQAISPEPCKPFDADRKGISLGEGAATMVLSTEKTILNPAIRIRAGSVTNDANHISGPSRTGEELHFAIQQVIRDSQMEISGIDFVSAHGTATIYNDDMEARAFNLSKLEKIPVNSLKGYYGHTLGAAGLIESVISIHSLRENLLIPTLGFSEAGTAMPLHIIERLENKKINNCLKTASGFGGCNAAMMIIKD